MGDDKRNLSPTTEARVAMDILGEAYSEQSGGSMDFWDSLPEEKKTLIKMVVALVRKP